MELETVLKHIANYKEIYEVLWNGPVQMDALKEYLMKELGKPESTARSYISAIKNGNTGLIYVDEDNGTFELNQDLICEFEKELEILLRWDEFDDRSIELKQSKQKLSELRAQISHMDDVGYLRQKNWEFDEAKMKCQIRDLEKKIKEYEGKDLRLRCFRNIISLNTVEPQSDNLKDLTENLDAPVKRLHRFYNPFQRIKSEYKMRRAFAEEMMRGEWYITSEDQNGEIQEYYLLPINEFLSLCNELNRYLGHGKLWGIDGKLREKKDLVTSGHDDQKLKKGGKR